MANVWSQTALKYDIGMSFFIQIAIQSRSRNNNFIFIGIITKYKIVGMIYLKYFYWNIFKNSISNNYKIEIVNIFNKQKFKNQ